MELKIVLRIRNGVPFKQVEKLVGKLHHTAIGIPSGKALFGPINQLMVKKPSGQGGISQLEATPPRSIEGAYECKKTCTGGSKLQGYTLYI